MNATTYTDLEKTVFNALVEFCFDECEANTNDLVTATGLAQDTIIGVVGSLVKKNIVQVGEDQRNGAKYKTINPIVNGELFSFGCDEYDWDNINTLKI